MLATKPLASYLVTGAAGFIGSNLVDYLLAKNAHVIGIDNFSPYYSKKIKELNLTQITQNPKSKNFTFARADLTSGQQMEPIFKEYKFDAVLNVAGWGGVTQSFEQPLTYLYNNTYGVLNLLELCKKHDVKKFVQASTSSEYGENPIPWTEDMDRDKPLHPYAASKRSAEIFGYTYHKQHGIDFTATIFFNVYGPRQRPEMALSMLIKAFLTNTPFPL